MFFFSMEILKEILIFFSVQLDPLKTLEAIGNQERHCHSAIDICCSFSTLSTLNACSSVEGSCWTNSWLGDDSARKAESGQLNGLSIIII